MKSKPKFSHKVIAVYFTITFLSTLVPSNQLLANNNGPKAPEAGSFEPVDATDMVSLLTGDVNYVLPLLNVPSPEGSYPLSLAYHAGIAYDQDATWVGLGWNLNPGVINRSINGYPDDWSGGLIRNRNKYEFEVESINISLGIGDKVQAEIGLGYSWDSNGSQSGSVSMSISQIDPSTGTKMSASIGVGYHSSEGWSANAGASFTNKNGLSVGVGADTNGNASISVNKESKKGNSLGVSFGTSGLSLNAQANGIGSASYDANQSVSPDVTTMDVGVKIPLAPKTFLKLGYSKIKYSKNETYLNKVWGPLHYKDLNDNPRIADDVTYGNVISTEHHRDYFMDSYDQPLPETEKEIIDFDDTFEKYQHSFSNPAYDSYVVNAQGLSGSMSPRLLENAYLIGKGYKLEYATNDDLGPSYNLNLDQLFSKINTNALQSSNEGIDEAVTSNSQGWYGMFDSNIVSRKEKLSAVVNHHFDSNRRFNKKYGNGHNDLHFYFDHQLHSNLLINQNSINTGVSSSANNINNFFNGNYVNQIGRVENTNFIESFTNKEINNLNANGGYFLESKDFDRVNQKGAKAGGIGGYRITTADGKTYHYSQPVYHYEEFYRQLTPKADSDPNHPENYSEHKFYHEQRKMEPYATHWLLTAITGPDYVKRSNDSVKYPTEGDYGYWIRFDYGSWTNGYIWKNPSKDGEVYNNLVFDKTNASRDYSWGRKQLVYLNKIVTRTHTALFVKSLRDDNKGSKIGDPNPFINSWYPNPNRFPSYEGDDYVYYPKQSSLKLDEIILVKNEDDNTQLDNINGNITSNPNLIVNVNWNTMDDISYPVNQQNNVLDSKDLQLNGNNYAIYDKALKVVRLNQDYSLAEDTSNNYQGRLTLKGVDFLGKQATPYMPPYSFEYEGQDINYTPCLNYENCSKDAWGYDAVNPSLWSMNKIKTPLGSEIRIDYEEDDYYTEAFARRYWTEGLSFRVDHYDSTRYKITVKNSPDFTDPIDFTDYFIRDEKVGLDLWMARRRTETSSIIDDCDRFGTAFNLNINAINNDAMMPEAINIESGKMELLVNKNVGYGNLIIRPLINGMKTDDILTGQELWQSSTCPSTGYYEEKDRGEIPSNRGCSSTGSSNRKNHTMSFGIIANRIPIADTGGGIRAKSISTHSATGDFFKVQYDYKDPNKLDNDGLNRSSGITSYAPVRGYKYVAYQSELPGPKVNYEYVTMSQIGMDGLSLGKTQYHFDVLKPAVNIFSKNLTIGNHFKSQVSESSLAHSTKGADVKLFDNTAMIGSLLDVTEFNSEDHMISKKINNYKGFDQLENTNQGSLQESFLSMKSIYDLHAMYAKMNYGFSLIGDLGDDETTLPIGAWVNYTKNLYLADESTLNLKKRFANVSTKVTYPIIQESSEVISNGFKTKSWFSNPDPKTGEYLTTNTQLSDGSYLKSDKVPAYTKYPQMGSKVDDITNKNMLTQEAMTVSSWSQYGNSYGWQTLNANITTWNDNWTYRDIAGNETSQSGIWRKHKSFVWKDDINLEKGTYLTVVDNANDYFDWGLGQPTDSKWKNVSEITRYTHWSSPIETKDINNNFASSKMADNDSKVIAGGNASFTEMFASGAEYDVDGVYLDQEIKGANFRDNTTSHTGKYSLKIGTGDKGFETILKANEHSADNYKISVWFKGRESNVRINVNGVLKPFNGETVQAGDWVQLNHYEYFSSDQQQISITLRDDLPSLPEQNIDDFRIHPVYSSMNTYVYDQDTDELTYVLDANNLATKYVYDKAGRLCKLYSEVAANSSTNGGFKLINQYKYNYKDQPSSSDCMCCEDDLSQTLSPIQSNTLVINSIKELDKGAYNRVFTVDASSDSNNLSYRWRWLTDYRTNSYSSFISGTDKQEVPFTVKICDSRSNTYDKVWELEVEVTDNSTGEVKTSKEKVELSGCNFTFSTNQWADIEFSSNYDSCSPNTKYTFRPFVIQPDHQNYTYQYKTYNHVNGQWSIYQDVSLSNGNFCSEEFFVPSVNCKSEYSLYQTFQYRVIDNVTGDIYQSNVFDVYLDCVEDPIEIFKLSNSDYHTKYNKFGNVVEKTSQGEEVRVYNFMDIINNRN